MRTIVFELSPAEKRGSYLPYVDYFVLYSAGHDGIRAEWDK